ncbi:MULTISPECIES: PilZ domain-containing protein [Thalassotalea]|uniref:PilZ domain-containing protein n=1 Tax=Thalassotalea TaxID=1518149 RepID=UPI0009444EA6|nr:MULTISPECIES: PilZ domain-containing protein [Thalassotalea]MDO6428484.1 PilZ domain-containing protein [Thalassotalea sp. 1_MG-2023]OKY24946.1 PilZ domain-containing protein [Thalassotalea sp. PP2-459]
MVVSYDDKRDFYRMMLNSDVTVTIIDDEANSTILATCRDLSATGMAIEMAHPIELNTDVRVNMESSGSNVQPLDVSGKVVRVEEESADNYLIGINISEID